MDIEDEDEAPPPAQRALQAFGGGLVQQLTGEAETATSIPATSVGEAQTVTEPKRTRSRKAAEAAPINTGGGAMTSATADGKALQYTSFPVRIQQERERLAAGYENNVNIHISGLPEHAVAAALTAIAASLAER
jgi:hypothetical protein